PDVCGELAAPVHRRLEDAVGPPLPALRHGPTVADVLLDAACRLAADPAAPRRAQPGPVAVPAAPLPVAAAAAVAPVRRPRALVGDQIPVLLGGQVRLEPEALRSHGTRRKGEMGEEVVVDLAVRREVPALLALASAPYRLLVVV